MSDATDSYHYPSSCKEVNGKMSYFYHTEEYLQSITRLPLRKDDIIVSTYPKSGQTWVLEIIKQIMNGGSIDETPMYRRTPFLDAFAMQKALNIPFVSTYESLESYVGDMPSPRVMKTHLRYHLVPRVKGSAVKYITIMRNPKDVAVSFFHHHRSIKFFNFSRPWDEFFEMFINGRVIFGSWFDHVLEWWEHRNDPNTLFLKYEDINTDHHGNIRKIADFLGKDVTDDVLQRVSEHSSFQFMKTQPYFDITSSVAHVKGEAPFLRTGIVGGWRNYFTEEQNQRFDELYAEKMKGRGLELDFGE